MIPAAMLADALLNVMTAVQAGFQLEAICAECKAMSAQGKTDDDISAYLKTLRDKAISEVDAALK